MDLALDESERILQHSFAEFFSKECSIARVRETEHQGFDAALWQATAQMGALGMSLQESEGGLGLNSLASCLVAQEAGRVLAPLPFAQHNAALPILAAFGDNESIQQALSGQCILALLPLQQATALQVLVSFGAVVNKLLVMIDGQLRIYDADSARLDKSAENLSGANHAYWDLGAAHEVLASGDTPLYMYQQAIAQWQLLTAASLVGLAQQALDIGVEYAKTREQFSTAIGAFQAIAHPLADNAMDIDGAQLLVWKAAWAQIDQPKRYHELCAMALVFAAQTAQEAAATSLHTHGGYGFTEEYDIQLFYRRAAAWPMLLGGVADTLLQVSAQRSKDFKSKQAGQA